MNTSFRPSRAILLGAIFAAAVLWSLAVKPATAGSPVNLEYGSCNNPPAKGYGQTTPLTTVTTAVTILTDNGGNCNFRYVEIYRWNGSAWVSSGSQQSSTSNVGVGIDGTPSAYAVHRIGWSEWFYIQALSYS